MNEHARDRLTARNATNVSLGYTGTGWQFRHSFLGDAQRDPRLWVPASNPYDWVGADLYSGPDGSVVDYGGTGLDVNGDSKPGNPDRAVSLAQLRSLDLWVPEWGVYQSSNDDQDVTAFYDWYIDNQAVVKGMIYYNRSVGSDDFKFHPSGQADARRDEWVSIFSTLNG
jgi:hypothetical protein